MSELSDRIRTRFEEMKQRRDELRVQLDLGKKDAADAWHALDKRWAEVEAKYHQLEREGQETTQGIHEATDLLLDEIREGFEKLKKLI